MVAEKNPIIIKGRHYNNNTEIFRVQQIYLDPAAKTFCKLFEIIVEFKYNTTFKYIPKIINNALN